MIPEHVLLTIIGTGTAGTLVGTTIDLYGHVLPNMQAEAATVGDAARRAALKKRRPKGGNRLVPPHLEDREA